MTTATANVSCRQNDVSSAAVTFMNSLACTRLSVPAIIFIRN